MYDIYIYTCMIYMYIYIYIVDQFKDFLHSDAQRFIEYVGLFQKKYFASSGPHHDISKQLVDTTFVWSFCHGTFAQLTIPIICFTWQVIVHVSLSNRI